MKFLLLISFAAFYTTDALLTERAISAAWSDYKVLFGRQFSNVSDETTRKTIFAQRLQEIEDHNERYRKGLETFEKGVNKFTDFTEEELYPYTHGVLPSLEAKSLVDVNSTVLMAAGASNVPDSFSWNECNALTPVKNQGSCGSCWAFAAAGVLEAHYNIRHKTKVSLSEQQLVDCSIANNGCKGGRTDRAFKYIFQNGGLNYDTDYPYETKNGLCRYNPKKPKVTIRAFARVTLRDEETMKKIIATRGPIAVGIEANNDFRSYRNGVFYSKTCSSWTWNANHAVVVVGYGTQNGQDYWLVKNSWGEDWGLAGYIKMARNRNNHCGIANDAIYPLL